MIAPSGLSLYFASNRRIHGLWQSTIPSRFLDELPPEDLEWEGQEDAPVEVKAASGNDALAAKRAMLKK